VKRLYLLSAALLLWAGCGGVRVSSERALIARDLSIYSDKRAVVLAFREPDSQRGIGKAFATELHRRLLQGGPFSQVSLRLEASPFGLQSTPREELATAAALGAELGADLAITGEVERFSYSRGANSELVISVWFIDTVSGEVMRADRLSARGKAGSFPPVWEPGLSSGPEREEIISKLAIEVVRRLANPGGNKDAQN
jgi:hypothetical protein